MYTTGKNSNQKRRHQSCFERMVTKGGRNTGCKWIEHVINPRLLFAKFANPSTQDKSRWSISIVARVLCRWQEDCRSYLMDAAAAAAYVGRFLPAAEAFCAAANKMENGRRGKQHANFICRRIQNVRLERPFLAGWRV
jgi:hypothetical protein